ncbi:MAG TPA: hypothetical protein VEU62_07870 [Bryobacterales bacterium]|nr:hypothetical protein [Bryobacterales bacterium]
MSDAGFATNKYAVLRALVKNPTLASCYKYAMRAAENGRMDQGDSQVPGTPSAYGDPMMETLLEKLVPEIERAVALAVYPTYSYFRVYKRGDVLKKHTDRPSCEISLSVNLGCQAERPWPLWIEGPGGASPISLEPGDAVLYRGIECFHWREAFAGEHAVQLFLHYVDRNGPHAEWKFDKRPGLRSFLNRSAPA